jgi:hypothetical protein
MRGFNGEYAHFSVNKCPNYTHDGASAKFSTNSHETDNSVSTVKQLLDRESSPLTTKETPRSRITVTLSLNQISTSFYRRLLEIHTFKDDVNGVSSISDIYLIPLTDWEREISAF